MAGISVHATLSARLRDAHLRGGESVTEEDGAPRAATADLSATMTGANEDAAVDVAVTGLRFN